VGAADQVEEPLDAPLAEFKGFLSPINSIHHRSFIANLHPSQMKISLLHIFDSKIDPLLSLDNA